MKRSAIMALTAITLISSVPSFCQDYVSFGAANSPYVNFYADNTRPLTAKTAILPFWITSQIDRVSPLSVWNPLGLKNLSDFSSESYASILLGFIDYGYELSLPEVETGGRSTLFQNYELSTEMIVLPTNQGLLAFNYTDFTWGLRIVANDSSFLIKAGVAAFVDPGAFGIRGNVLDVISFGFSEALRAGYGFWVGDARVTPFLEVKGVNILDQLKPLAQISLGVEYELGGTLEHFK